MPRRVNRKRTVRRKRPSMMRRRAKRSYNRMETRNSVSSNGFPVEQFVKMKYSDVANFQTVSGGCNGITYRMNSIYDPDVASVGPLGRNQQPYTYFQYQNMYAAYTVMAMKTRCKFLIQEPGSSCAPVACLILDTGLAAPTLSGSAMYTFRQWPRHKYGSADTTRPCVLTYYTKINKSAGVSKGKVTDDDGYSANFGANPTITPYVSFAAAAADTAALIDITCLIDTTYYVRVWGPKYVNIT